MNEDRLPISPFPATLRATLEQAQPEISADQANLAPWTGPEKFRNNCFDFLRFFFASIVIISHAYVLTRGDDPATTWTTDDHEPLYILTRGQASLGHIAVDGFFLMSGYMVTQSFLASRGVGSYLRKRIFRIYPGFIVAAGVSLLVGLYAGGRASVSLRGIALGIGNVLRLRPYPVEGAFANNPYPLAINGSLWTIPFEFWCYIAVLLLGVLGWLKSRGPVLVVALLASVLAVVEEVHDIRPHAYAWRPSAILLGRFEAFFGSIQFWPRLLSYFMTGAAFLLWRDRVTYRTSLALASIALLVMGALVPPGLQIVGPFAMTYLVMFISYHPQVPLRHFAKHGDYSYGIYLYAFPIQQLLIYKNIAAQPWSNALLAFALTAVCAMLSWYLVEKPFMVRKQKRN